MRELLARQLSLRFGIVSFAAVPFDPLMWSHYTGDGSGFVIGYKTECLRSLAGDEERLREVTYSSSPPALAGYVVALEPESNRYVLLCIKSSHWEYEKEWRLIVELDRTVGTGARDQHGQPINLVRIANSAVAKVYYTERTPVDSVDEIKRRLADALGPGHGHESEGGDEQIHRRRHRRNGYLNAPRAACTPGCRRSPGLAQH